MIGLVMKDNTVRRRNKARFRSPHFKDQSKIKANSQTLMNSGHFPFTIHVTDDDVITNASQRGH